MATPYSDDIVEVGQPHSRARSWLFTKNNPPQDFNDLFRKLCAEISDIKYAVWQLEEAPTTKTKHIQGYIEFTTSVRFARIVRMLPGAHVFVRRGTRDQARNYCMKKETKLDGPWEYGEWRSKGQGNRSDLAEVIKKSKDTPEKELAEEYPGTWARNFKAIREFKRLCTPRRTEKPYVIAIWGPTDVGKTHIANELLPNAYWKSRNTGSSQYWDGYEGQEDVIIDEFNTEWIHYELMLRLLDKYPLMVDIKFGHANFVAKRIIITSMIHPKDWFPRAEYAPLERRLNEIVYIPNRERSQIYIDSKKSGQLQCDEVLTPMHAETPWQSIIESADDFNLTDLWTDVGPDQ